MTDKDNLSETEIDDMLARAGDVQAVASGDLLARIVADADAVADQRDVAGTPGRAPQQSGVFARLTAALGGWPAIAGLTTATVAGIWIGYVSPDTLSAIAEGYISIGASDRLGDFMPAFTDILDEG